MQLNSEQPSFGTQAEAPRYASLVASYEKMYEPVGPEHPL